VATCVLLAWAFELTVIAAISSGPTPNDDVVRTIYRASAAIVAAMAVLVWAFE
jgi:hypothetical protein